MPRWARPEKVAPGFKAPQVLEHLRGEHLGGSAPKCRQHHHTPTRRSFQRRVIVFQLNPSSKRPRTLMEAVRYFADDSVCEAFIRSIKWPTDEPICPKCGSINV